ncbi:galactosylgalactosylxylosylprotein 3-beta-glucuronosyltransferase 3-like [Acanthaster planci]|uniref:Galactosylgalactosylxylosylprotein 3-beta-glucuronosyltransferase n=1 Tax=Acanthaster planci TaxID=133434 RepID=A0A8B7YTA5_ACAPL|nr:galactosylgalactosylxylosylprotein 3-beta-glucuronosyltransferase 3-like [Acanthaster planci]
MRGLWRPRTFVCLYFVISTGGILWLLVNYDSFCSESAKHASHKHPYLMRVINADYKTKQAELVRTENTLKEERKLLENVIVHLRQQYPQAVGSIVDSLNVLNASLPTIYAVTPTHTRPVQKAELTRIAQTFLHVRNFHWIVVEDSNTKTSLVTTFLRKSGMKYTHLNCRTPEPHRLGENDPNWLKPRGVEQRNTAIEWLLEKVDVDKNPGVVYFADDDNTYSLQIFEEMRYTQRVSMWPVGLVGGQMYESPRVDRNGKVTGWNVGWQPQRPFPMDMAGFAINLRLLKAKPLARFSPKAKRGYLESSLLVSLVTMDDLEPKASLCTRIYVWHTRTEKPKLKYDIKDSDVQMEV